MYDFPYQVLKVNDYSRVQGVYAMKFREGQYNKVFQLVMDNGAQVVAKIPNPNAGPAYYTTASEVATVDFVIYQIYCGFKRLISLASDCSGCPCSKSSLMECRINERSWFRIYHHGKGQRHPSQ